MQKRWGNTAFSKDIRREIIVARIVGWLLRASDENSQWCRTKLKTVDIKARDWEKWTQRNYQIISKETLERGY